MAEVPQSCPYGHTNEDLRLILNAERLQEFWQWMSGQTAMFCNGLAPDCQETHGGVVYASDLRQFLTGRGPVDW